jgi:hypothetical protein
METLAGQLARSDAGIRVRWDERIRSGDVDPDLPYVAMGTLATLLVDAVTDEPAIDLSNLFRDLERRLTEALPATRKLLIVGFLEDLQNLSLNRGMPLASWRRWLGPATGEAWSMIEGMWSGSTSPEQFNYFVDRSSG